MGLISRVSSRTYRSLLTNLKMTTEIQQGYSVQNVCAYGYSALCFIGGAVGYAKSGSLPSIIAGSAIGLINAGGTYAENDTAQLVSSGVMGVVMGKRFFATGKVMPPGFFFGVSTVYFSYQLLNNMPAGTKSKHFTTDSVIG